MTVILSRKGGGGSGSGTPTGPAGGDLSGTYPNPELATSLRPLVKLFDSTLALDATGIDTGANAIPGSYDVIQAYFIARTTQATSDSSLLIRVNGDSGANYDYQEIRGSLTTAGAAVTQAGTSWSVICPGSTATADLAATYSLFLFAYAQTTFLKGGWVTVADVSAAQTRARTGALTYRATSAITQLSISAGSGDLVAGSRLIVYGI